MRRKFDGRFNARKREALAYFGIESAAALVVALVINLCVLSVFARGFYGRDPPAKIGLENAGEYLGDTFGPVMRVIWAVGLLAAGAGTSSFTFQGGWGLRVLGISVSIHNMKLRPAR